MCVVPALTCKGHTRTENGNRFFMLLITLNFVDPINCIQNTNIRFEQHKIYLLMNTMSRKPEPESLFGWYYLNNNSKERYTQKKTNSVKIANTLHLLFYHYIRSFPSFRSFRFVSLGYIICHCTTPNVRLIFSYCTYTEFGRTISYRTVQNYTTHAKYPLWWNILCAAFSAHKHFPSLKYITYSIFDCVYSVWNSYRIEMYEGKKPMSKSISTINRRLSTITPTNCWIVHCFWSWAHSRFQACYSR